MAPCSDVQALRRGQYCHLVKIYYNLLLFPYTYMYIQNVRFLEPTLILKFVQYVISILQDFVLRVWICIFQLLRTFYAVCT